MSVKPITSAPIVSPTPKLPVASSADKVSKYIDEKFSSRLPQKPTRNISTYHLSTVEEREETGEIFEPIRTSAPVNLTPPVTKPSKEDFRKMALLNKASANDNSK